MTRTAKDIADSYYRAWREGGDFSDVPFAANLQFRGSIDKFDNAEQFLAMTEKFAPMVKGYKWKAQLADDQYVASFYDFENASPVDSAPDRGTDPCAKRRDHRDRSRL